jgi:hypothetical protein
MVLFKDYIKEKYSLENLELWNTEFGFDSEHIYNSRDYMETQVENIWQWFLESERASNNLTNNSNYNSAMQNFLNSTSDKFLRTVCGNLKDVCLIAPQSNECQQFKTMNATATSPVEWVTENGMHVNTSSFVRVPYRNVVNGVEKKYTYLKREGETLFKPNLWVDEIQAQWLVRSYLDLYLAGVDSGAVYWMSDEAEIYSNTSLRTFASAGLIEKHSTSYAVCSTPTTCYCKSSFDKHKPKPAWYYLKSLKKLLKDFKYEQLISAPVISDSNPIRILKLRNINDNKKLAYIAWIADGRGRLDDPISQNGGVVYDFQSTKPEILKHKIFSPTKLHNFRLFELMTPLNANNKLVPHTDSLTDHLVDLDATREFYLEPLQKENGTEFEFRVSETPVIIYAEE